MMQMRSRFFTGIKAFIFNALIIISSNAWAADALIRVTNMAGAPIENAVVYLEGSIPIPKKISITSEIVQKNKTFVPFVTVIQTGSIVTFPNKDSVRHHVYSFSPAKKFELKLYSGVPSSPVLFDQAGLVVLGCNIHDNMLAYVYVVETPYYGKTETDGKVKLVNIPDGQYQLKVWHPDLNAENLPFAESISIKDSFTITAKLDIR
jgi:plastocyanin